MEYEELGNRKNGNNNNGEMHGQENGKSHGHRDYDRMTSVYYSTIVPNV